MTIRQHIPAFVDGIEPGRADFETLEQLLAVPFVKRWSEPAEAFRRYSYVPRRYEYRESRNVDYLMAEMADGKHWVIGYIEPGAGERFGLPEWKAAA